MSTKSTVDLRAELAELVKRKAEIAVSVNIENDLFTVSSRHNKKKQYRLAVKTKTTDDFNRENIVYIEDRIDSSRFKGATRRLYEQFLGYVRIFTSIRNPRTLRIR